MLDLQIRFNQLNSWVPGERLDVWIARYRAQTGSYHGFRDSRRRGGVAHGKAAAAAKVGTP